MVLVKVTMFLFFTGILISDNFQNIKVLNIESRSEMKKYMKSISKDLGVKFRHCHDMDDKSIDTPEKEIAREMMILTRQINDYLYSLHTEKDEMIISVSCWTCHKGELEVEHKRPLEE